MGRSSWWATACENAQINSALLIRGRVARRRELFEFSAWKIPRGSTLESTNSLIPVDAALLGSFYRGMTGPELKLIREYMKMSRSELAQRLGTTRQWIWGLEQKRGQIDLVYEWAIVGLWCEHQGLFNSLDE